MTSLKQDDHTEVVDSLEVAMLVVNSALLPSIDMGQLVFYASKRTLQYFISKFSADCFKRNIENPFYQCLIEKRWGWKCSTFYASSKKAISKSTNAASSCPLRS